MCQLVTNVALLHIPLHSAWEVGHASLHDRSLKNSRHVAYKHLESLHLNSVDFGCKSELFFYSTDLSLNPHVVSCSPSINAFVCFLGGAEVEEGSLFIGPG